MDKQKASAFIIVYNEEENMKRCLDSVQWADEIIVVDSYSTDKTLDICKIYTDKIYQRRFTDFADMKNFALSKVTNRWALSIDADEEVTDGLRDEIKKVVTEGKKDLSGFYIRRKSQIFGRWFNFSGTQDDFQMRLFKKEAAHYIQPVHEKVVVSHALGYLRHPLLHYTYDKMQEYVSRLNRYTSMEAKFLAKGSKHLLRLSMVMRPIGRFVQLYILKQGFRDGYPGFLFCWLSGFYVFTKYAKLLEYRNNI